MQRGVSFLMRVGRRLRRWYWRLRGGAFTLHPIAQLEPVLAVDGTWKSTGRDPKFACLSAFYPLKAGWYRFSVDMEVVESERLLLPRLYFDFGHGMHEEWSRELSLIPHESNRCDGVVLLPHDVYNMRFDPADTPCTFRVGRPVLRPVTRARAALQMLRTLKSKSFTLFGDTSYLYTESMRRLCGPNGRRAFASWLHGLYMRRNETKPAYDAWLDLYDETGVLDPVNSDVLVSILLPTYNTPEKWLRSCLDSVLAQSYPNWELCVADDASTLSHVREVLEQYRGHDSRIRVTFRRQNGHISAATNSALAMARGSFVALLDHDDELHPEALTIVVGALQKNPCWQMVYSDEDKIDEHGHRYDPYFKSDWNPDLLHGQNCVSHLGVYARTLLNAVGGMRVGFEGSQDWDLALRCSERLTTEEIGHIPRVLYHWRAIPGSTALGASEKNYAHRAGLRAVREHFTRTGVAARVMEIDGLQGVFRVRHPLPENHPLVSIIVPTRDKLELLRKCIDSVLERTTYRSYEIVIVDNQSSDPATLEYLDGFEGHVRVRVARHDHPFNYSHINNEAVRHCCGRLICFLNNDVEVITPEWLEELVSHALRPHIGAVGAMLYYPDDTIQHAGVVVGMHGVAAHPYSRRPRGYDGQMARARLTQVVSAVTAACLVVRREVFERAGGFDMALRIAFNDVDFCLRLRQLGYSNVWTPFAELYHWESASRGVEDTPEKRERFKKEVDFMIARWRQHLSDDPYYNPNLTLCDEPYTLAFPPRIGAALAAEPAIERGGGHSGAREMWGTTQLGSRQAMATTASDSCGGAG